MKPTELPLTIFEQLQKAGEVYTSKGLVNVELIFKSGGEAGFLQPLISELQMSCGRAHSWAPDDSPQNRSCG